MTSLKNFILRACFACSALTAGSAFALDISLPSETISYRPSQLPGYQMALRNCLTCHSAHYVQTQPPTSPRAYWDATVRKMKKPFGAPISDEEIPAIVDYLVKTYGIERDTAAPAPATLTAVEPEKSHKAMSTVKKIVIRKSILGHFP